jgi:uncharacterized OB-fold protein
MADLKPRPRATAETLRFWTKCADGELTYQSCEACGKSQFPPRVICVHCRSDKIVWRTSVGRGIIHSFTVVHRPPLDSFSKDVPYVIALIDLDEHFRMMMNVRNVDPASVRIDQRIKVVFEDVGDGMSLPQAMLDI